MSVQHLAAALAATLPSLLAYNPPPSPTLLNQALALAVWGLFAAVAAGAWRSARPAWPLGLALGGVALGVVGSWGPGALPSSLALSALGLLLAAAVMVAAGASARSTASAQALFAAFCWGWVVAGGVNLAIAAVQVFAPAWPDGTWLARSGLPGRAVGNLRQPNHLSSLLMWSALAVVALHQMGHWRPRPAAAMFAALVAGVVLTASRTGLVSVLLLAGWGLVDRSLARDVRRLLVAAPLLYGLAWGAMWAWAHAEGGTFGGEARLRETDISSSRFGIWANALTLIARQPWTGVGFGEFNLAWSMTPFPGRPTAFFDHAHNLPLHLLAELGLPLGGAVCVLLGWSLWRALRAAPGQQAPWQRCAAMFALMIGVHSLLEYPLWYAYFLLPLAWVWGFALGRPVGAAEPAPTAVTARLRPGLAAVVVLAALAVVADYQRVVRIFEAPAGAAPLAQRIADGRASLLFAHHGDYAAATTGLPQPDGLGAFDDARHYLLDTRLMRAWAEALAREGRLDEARWVAARLHEFGPARAGDFFAPCADPASAPGAWVCGPPPALNWRALQRD
ncbi:PglL family O-oligosaccharyltransferase [Rubrivivax albus]|uniref:Polymerase n=1 Tax=Rubrivivax albus TaxID=2499835 RepID=A0A3S2WW25_9BURK|nr:O-antigen ligase family protein [Rubrivivax albus]RVT52652.1 polymerase [Rubrivivax albus]